MAQRSFTAVFLLALIALVGSTPTPAPTNAPTPAPTMAPVAQTNSLLSVDFPTTAATAVNQPAVRQAIATSAGVALPSVVLLNLAALQGGGTRLNFQVISPMTTQATLQRVQLNCPAQLAPLGAQCSTVAQGQATGPSASSDDDGSQTAGIIVGSVLGGLCLLGMLGALAFFALRKPKAPASEFDLVPTPRYEASMTNHGPYGYPAPGATYTGGYPQGPYPAPQLYA